MALQFAAFALLAAVTNIGWLSQFGALHLLKILASFEALGFETGTAGLSISKFTGVAQITVVLAILANNAWIISSGLFELNVRTNFLGYCGWILAQFQCNGREAFTLSETDFNGNSVAKGQM